MHLEEFESPRAVGLQFRGTVLNEQIPDPDGEIAELRSNVAKKDINIHINIKELGTVGTVLNEQIPGPDGEIAELS